MSKRAKPEIRVIDYFRTADIAAAEVVLSMATDIVKGRRPVAMAPVVTRRPRKKATSAPAKPNGLLQTANEADGGNQ